jgi:hypothetical protein
MWSFTSEVELGGTAALPRGGRALEAAGSVAQAEVALVGFVVAGLLGSPEQQVEMAITVDVTHLGSGAGVVGRRDVDVREPRIDRFGGAPGSAAP